MSTQHSSPLIKRFSWGTIEVEGFSPLKDVKLYPGGCRAWDWNETGTRHNCIQFADFEELLERGAQVIVIGTGFYSRMKLPKATSRRIESRGATLHILQSEKAVTLYNQLREEHPVGALIHSTC